MNTAIEEYDIIVVGGGIVGLTFACAMADTSLKIGVLEAKSEKNRFTENYDLRVFAITPASVNLFQALDVWASCLSLRVSPFQKMQVWNNHGEIHFNAHDLGQPFLGYIVENNVLKLALEKRIVELDNVDYREDIELFECHVEKEKYILKAHDGTLYKAPLVIGADGANSWLRREAKIELLSRDYGHHAIVAVVETEKPHQKTAWQHFLNSGPLAFLPLHHLTNENYCSIVWSTKSAHAKQLLALEDGAFIARLEDAFEHRLGQILQVGKRLSYPLIERHAKQYVKPGIALIGDAAHTIHPLAGQGMNLGLLDAGALAETLKEAIGKNRSIASMAILRRFERWRKTDNLMMMTAMEAFVRLFASENRVADVLRNTGLSVVNKLSPVKNEIMKRAMGLTGSLPILCQDKN